MVWGTSIVFLADAASIALLGGAALEHEGIEMVKAKEAEIDLDLAERSRRCNRPRVQKGRGGVVIFAGATGLGIVE